MQLLFFDTFSHDATGVGGGELNLDLVQFPSPVVVGEVRVIPLGARVSTYFPGGTARLGATNPHTFQLECYVNNLGAPGASTFQSIGALHYQHQGNLSLTATRRVATDGLVVRGTYSAVTLAVYGTLTDGSGGQ